MALIPHDYLEAVVSIGLRKDTDIIWIGTGFFVIKPISEGKGLPFLVTNRHVLNGKQSVTIRLQEKNTGDLKIIDIPLMENGNLYYSTHDDSNVDIAAVLFSGSIIKNNNLQFSAINIDNDALISSELIKQGGDEGSYVYMLGFPMRLVNIDSTTPICRGGCIARIDEKEIKKMNYFLLDIQNFPGNSGSPIITKPEIYGFDNEPVLNKSVLIGIVYGYKPYQEQLINSQTNEIVEIRSENSGIAVVHPVEFIKEVIEKEMKRCYVDMV